MRSVLPHPADDDGDDPVGDGMDPELCTLWGDVGHGQLRVQDMFGGRGPGL